MVQEAKENSSHHSSSNCNSQHGDAEEQNEEQHRPDSHLEKPNHGGKLQVSDDYTDAPHHEANHSVEYTITGKDDDGDKQKYHMEAPLDEHSSSDLDVEPKPETERHLRARPEPERRISKPPRLESGIIPTLTTLVRDDEIGIAR